MAYLVPIHRPSSIRHALKLNFLDPDEECLVVAKANRLEIYAQTVDGLTLRHTRTIYGKITMLQKLRPASSNTDHLFIGTDRYTYFTVSWDPLVKQLRTEQSYVDQADKTARDLQSLERCLIDPTRRYLTLELYEGVMTVIPIVQKSKKKGAPEIGSLAQPVLVRISELFIRSSAYLYPRTSNPMKEKPTLAILYEDNQQKVSLKLRCLDYAAGPGGEAGMADLDEVGSHDELDLGASHLIPVPAPAYGLLVLGETCITYLNTVNHETLVDPLKEATIFSAWTPIDAQRWLLSDDYGKLYLLMLLVANEDQVTGWKLDVLGSTSRASVMVYLDHGYVFIGSHQGDSQVVRILEKSIEVVQTFSNIAPILDFTVMDLGSREGEGQTNEYSSGQARIVTGSGAFQDGSLRSVRSGVGMEELGSLGEMEYITDLYALRAHMSTVKPDALLASFIDETRIFQFSANGEVEEVDEFKGFSLWERTLLAANTTHDQLLQVTRTAARITDLDNGMNIASWSPSTGQIITAAATNNRFLALSIGGAELVVLDLIAELRVVVQKSFEAERQVACVDLPEIMPDICIVGFWQGADISILKVDTLENLHSTRVSEDAVAVPRSVLLTQIIPDQPPTVFVAMADGHVITYSMDITNFSLSAKNSIVLGTQQANFKALPRGDGCFNVFTTCEHPSLIYGSEGRIVYSAVTAETASCTCPFDSEAYPGAIAIATLEDLKIAMIDTERTTHVQTLPIHETVRRVAYSTKLKAFGLGTVKRTLIGGVEIVQSHFKLADEVVFKELDTYELDNDELVESVVRANLNEGGRKEKECFIVGTAYLDDEMPESVRGRIIVFEITEDRLLKEVTTLRVKGACRALAILDGKIVAALVKTVVVYDFEYGSLHKIASYRTATAPIDIAIGHNFIAVADLMKSVSILEFKRGTAGEPDSLVEVARHFQIVWATAVASIGDETFLESDAEGNLLVLRRNINGVTAEDRRRLEATSEILLGEMVNRIRGINVPTSRNSTVTPKAFLATVEGSIYLFALIQPEKQDLLMRLQSSIAKFVQSPGDIPFNKFRAYKNQVRQAEEPYRFVDGELIEKFLECSSSVQEEIVEGLGVGIEDMTSMVESLRRLH